MNSLTKFLKNRQKKKLLRRIENLKAKLTLCEKRSKANQTSADEILFLIEFHKRRANAGDPSSYSWLNCYLDIYLSKYDKYSDKSAINLADCEKIKYQIVLLEEQLNNL